MNQNHFLILNDKYAKLRTDGSCWRKLNSPDEIVGLTKGPLILVLNHPDFDITRTEIPNLSWLDRRQYLHSRLKYHGRSILYGIYARNNVLIEFSCPKTQEIVSWIEHLIAYGIQIKEIRPYLIFPKQSSDRQLKIIITSHQSFGLRQTAFLGSTPFFTRTSENNIDEVASTVSFLKNNYQEDITLELYLDPLSISKLKTGFSNDQTVSIEENVTNDHIDRIYTLQKSRNFRFELPLTLKKNHTDKVMKRLFMTGVIGCLALLSVGAYEFNVLNELRLKNSELEQTLISQQQKLEFSSNKYNVPESYKNLSSPIKLLSLIASCLPDDIRTSRVMWSNQDRQQICEVDLYLKPLIAEPTIARDKLNHLLEELRSKITGFNSQIESHPFHSGSNEYFTGTSSSDEFKLHGKGNAAKLKLVSKR